MIRITKLSDDVLSLWGKKNNDDGQELWLPLVTHLVDTRHVINFLFNNWLSNGQKKLLYETLSEEEVLRLVRFLGQFHDIAKAIPAFQKEKSFNRNEDLDNKILEKLLRNGFEQIDETNLPSPHASHHTIAGEALLESKGLNESVGAIIGGHHGKPQSKFFTPDDQLDAYPENFYQDINNLEIEDHWKKVQDELIQFGLEKVGYKNLSEVPKVTQPQAVLLEGLLIMADWLASCQSLNGQPMFSLIPMDKGFYDVDEQSRFQNAILTWKTTDKWVAENVNDITGYYKKHWGFTPRPVQLKMSTEIGKIIDPGIIIVEAQTGIGKSEISMLAAQQTANVAGESGLFFGLPTQATSNAMFDRIDGWLNVIAKNQKSKLNLKLMHGKAQFNYTYRNLPEAESICDSDSGDVTVNSWFSGKKSILTDFTVGTIDQLLLMSLKQKHLFLKHLGFSGKVVIIDEVHAYDTYMSSYLNKSLEWLGAYHVPVIALSATLPKEKRKELIESYARGKYGRDFKLESEDDWQNNQAYPLLTYLDGPKLIQFDDFEKIKKDKKIDIIRFSADDQTTVNKIMSEIENGGIAGVVVNTIKRAQALKKLIPSDIPSMILHSSFLAEDRAKLETELEKKVGKGAKRPKKMIVIGTQVLEQSLDIDFDVLFTDIAPIDLIFQRIGRLHRHDISRPQHLAKAKVYVMGINGPDDYGEGNESIYEKYILRLTDYYLPNEILIPTDISKLVQKVYDEVSENLKKYSLMRTSRRRRSHANLASLDSQPDLKKLIKHTQNEKIKASTFQIDAPVFNKTIHGWLDSSGKELTENKASASVRDIKETIEVILLKKIKNDYCLINGQKLNSETVTSEIIAQQLIRLPSAITPNINATISILEQSTLCSFPSWQKDKWLKQSIALVLDENNEFELSGYHLKYSSKMGLSYEKVMENG